MHNNRNWSLLLTFSCATLLSACALSSKVPVNTIYQSQQCAIGDSQLIFLDSPGQIQDFLASTDGHQLSSKALGKKVEGKDGGSQPDQTFTYPAEGRAIAVAWGERPNGGYRLELEAQEADIVEDTLSLPVKFLAPEAGKVTTQQLTSPCIVIAVDSKDGYERVQAGELISWTPGNEY